MSLQILKALEDSQESHIFHYNLMPDNIFIDLNGDIKIFEFGFFSFYIGEENILSKKELIRASQIFVAPEILNHTSSKSTPDLYSFGIIVYYMCYKKVKFRSSLFQKMKLTHF